MSFLSGGSLDNYEEFDEVPEGKIAFVDYIISEKTNR